MKTLIIYSFSILVLLLSGCNKDKIPGVYRIDIQQGNAITQEMINQLKPGMTKSQVAYVMGSPLIIDTFHPNRWDYLYSFHPGNGQRQQRKVTLFFTEDEKLINIEGDVRTVEADKLTQEQQRTESNVVVPLSNKKTGVFRGILNTIGLGGDEADQVDQPEQPAQSTDSEPTPEKALDI